MKYCPKCGLEAECKYCPNCGIAMVEKTPRCPKCGIEVNSKFCPNCGTAISRAAGYSATPGTGSVPTPPSYSSGSEAYRSSASPAADPSSYKLGWHKFLIYFALWCAGLLDAATGLQYFQTASELMRYYSLYGNIFRILGIAAIALGIFVIYVRFQLAGFKSGAPTKLLIANGATLAINVIGQLLAASLIRGYSGEELISGAAGSLVFLIICWRYYSNRQALFVH